MFFSKFFRLERCILPTIIALATFLRFWNLKYNPLWYGDEGINLNLAMNAIEGHPQLDAIKYPFLPHAPLFMSIVGFLLKIFGNDILVLRSVTATLGVLTVPAVYLLGSELLDRKAGLLTAFFYAILPLPVLYSRWGFDYNILSFTLPLTCLLFLRYFKRKQLKCLLSGGFLYSASLIANYLAASLFPALIIAVLFYDRKRNVFTLVGLTMIFPLLLLADMFIFLPKELLFDTVYLQNGIWNAGVMYFESLQGFFFNQMQTPMDFYAIILGFMGMLALPLLAKGKSSRIATLFFVTAFFITLRVFIIHGPHIHGVLHFYPYIALGLAALIYSPYRKVRILRLHSVFTVTAPLLLIAIVSGYSIFAINYDYRSVVYGYSTPIDSLCLKSPSDAYMLAEWINSHTTRENIVIASPHYAWLLKCRTADILQSVVAGGKPTVFYPILPADRFAYNCSYVNAKYFIFDSFVVNWSSYQLNANEIVEGVLKNWNPVYAVGEYVVYQNPRLS